MKISRIMKILGGCIFIISIIIMFALQGIALEVDTHRAINLYIVDKTSTFNGYSLDKYLKENLGIVDGVTAKFNLRMVQDWIGDGGEFEDKPSGCVPYWRSRNHFHNPIDDSGFSGIWDTGFLSGMSAIDWINQPINTQSCGYYSWDDARKYYYAALTAPDKATRETNFTNSFILTEVQS